MADEAVKLSPEAADIGAAQAFDPVPASGSGARRARLFFSYRAQRVIVFLIMAGGFHSYKSWSPLSGLSAKLQAFLSHCLAFRETAREMILRDLPLRLQSLSVPK